MDYDFRKIEAKWQKYWAENKVFKTIEDKTKPKYYILDMFPYPSGAGLHVGHPLGYIASDIFSRYKRLKGFNVLHPMGYDAFGLPAEQYAIQTGQHPEITTNKNIERYRQQLDRIGFSYDWDREIRTSDPKFYKWTQWAFIQMFNAYYNKEEDKARPISELISHFSTKGTLGLNVAEGESLSFSAEDWNSWTEQEQAKILMNYRIAYLGETSVNWCPQLGTVLANDEVKDGLSVRGGYPVVQKMMSQWQLRVSAYAERLLNDMEALDWSDSLKEMQRNWIGRSFGTELVFKTISGDKHSQVTVFTTRVDTIYGVSFMVLAPESDLLDSLVTDEYREAVKEYKAYVAKKTERERIAETKHVTGVFTGAYGINPFTNEQIPIWVSEYVLAAYGTGAIMAVPAHDSRDYAFAKKFNLPIIPIIADCDVSEECFDAKEGKLVNSGFLNGLDVKEAIVKAMDYVEENSLGRRKINYRLRDAIFSRQRYWGEPFPVYYENNVAKIVDIKDLPLTLPQMTEFKPASDGQSPLANARDWTYQNFPLETSTMPGFAGSSAYYLRYMDPHNENELVSKEANQYWENVDLYIGGTEHATGHLIYSRFWNKFLYDFGYVSEKEPFKKLVNQGMIQGRSNFVYRIVGTNKFVSLGLKDKYETSEIHVDVNLVKNDKLDIDGFRKWRPEFETAEFELEDGEYICGWAVEKMSKSMYNVVNPDLICDTYGADTLRLYEMFLGPLQQSKPWDTNGIDGVHRFLKKLWRLFYNEDKLIVEDIEPNKEELKVLHKLIHKVEVDIENFSYNTMVSAFMIAVNELTDLKSHKLQVLSDLLILLSPVAPHIAEELWRVLGNEDSISYAKFPEYKEEYTVEHNFTYPVSFNGKTRFTVDLPKTMMKEEIETYIVGLEQTIKHVADKTIVKIIVVPQRIINIVIK